MEAAVRPTLNRWLPYWAVLQADLAQTMQSWVYRVWVFVLLLSATGIILYRYGLAKEAGIVQPWAQLMADLFRWALLGSGSLVVVLTAGTISSERGTMADSVLSRGISRYQYFLGKWHSRLFSVLVTFLVLALAALIVGSTLLHDDPVNPLGAMWALGASVCLLAVVVTCGVAVSAIVNSTVLGIAVVWVLLYGGGFLLSLLPQSVLSPDRALARMDFILRGNYDVEGLARLMIACGVVSLLAAAIGMLHFSQRDI
jgi:ABC-type transport system involved in multi-copper enzyme maturation permease subunit